MHNCPYCHCKTEPDLSSAVLVVEPGVKKTFVYLSNLGLPVGTLIYFWFSSGYEIYNLIEHTGIGSLFIIEKHIPGRIKFSIIFFLNLAVHHYFLNFLMPSDNYSHFVFRSYFEPWHFFITYRYPLYSKNVLRCQL